MSKDGRGKAVKVSFAVVSLVMIPVLLTGIVAILYAIFHKPKEKIQITYLSPEALDIKHQEIESIRLDSLMRSYTQEDVDRANEQCDQLYSLYAVK